LILSLGSQLKRIVASISSKCAGLTGSAVLDVVTVRAGIRVVVSLRPLRFPGVGDRRNHIPGHQETVEAVVQSYVVRNQSES
jgi:hypothetical protein